MGRGGRASRAALGRCDVASGTRDSVRRTASCHGRTCIAGAWFQSMSPSAEIVIDARAVTKRYKLFGNLREQIAEQMGLYRLRFWRAAPSFREVAALQDVGFQVRKGERIGIVGRNGAGKTTLLKMISGNFAPTSGDIAVTGSVQALMQSTLGAHPEFT